MTQLLNWMALIGTVLRRNVRWMSWNLFLAFIPLGLSVWLFRRPTAHSGRELRSPLWWLGVLVFIAFLPNAPYILTDVIHLVEDIRRYQSIWVITLVVIPQHLLFILAGFEAYVLSLINLGAYLKRRGWGRWIVWSELGIHILSAIGIYLGRFQRFNSWDLITRLDTIAGTVLDDFAQKRPLVVTFLTFVIIAGLYWLLKMVTLALLLQRRYVRRFQPFVSDRSDGLS